MKKYTTDWKGTITIFAIIAIFNAVTFYWNKNPTLPLLKVIIGLVAWFVFVGFGILLMTVYSYASISGNTLKYVWLFFSRRTIDINSITEINDQPTFKVAKSQFRSLYVFYTDKNGDTKWIELRITIFPEKTLGRLIKDLKAINPRIELNKYSQKLMDSASE
ncbi:MAG: hypothetical protein A3J55_02625 [Candidatus Ryanbacteria bacterium RIFCSPHIGHO2_02_FULL_45_17b]|uniref:Uncharacterized protein n=1 Tax=Candidatus Ryanbacteria bacterium RIFCSPHIGHO2_01_FULL_45_22 TaxID=1802114 RepID=A0A1G2FYV2_9BACT|nr:MAG: hypothetical protein A2719_01060 [Candidatus Ryanbacteria bacterium RIFCSPHIGHO2_01_FULL_45_22]OGZ46821.1 MAG: hypothetical protein A3J55_02625 [Candidatus Ryanbacteria bacterium RIFCSPHIGHO2_02_FULL_45_17b]